MMASAPHWGIQVTSFGRRSCRPMTPGMGTAIEVDAADQETNS